ncbi:unnamed protein product [Peniophora sp. CBMAI 1063]|nr:unnamed protein product [Peniophora sp. CBMAI 1063]
MTSDFSSDIHSDDSDGNEAPARGYGRGRGGRGRGRRRGGARSNAGGRGRAAGKAGKSLKKAGSGDDPGEQPVTKRPRRGTRTGTQIANDAAIAAQTATQHDPEQGVSPSENHMEMDRDGQETEEEAVVPTDNDYMDSDAEAEKTVRPHTRFQGSVHPGWDTGEFKRSRHEQQREAAAKSDVVQRAHDAKAAQERVKKDQTCAGLARATEMMEDRVGEEERLLAREVLPEAQKESETDGGGKGKGKAVEKPRKVRADLPAHIPSTSTYHCGSVFRTHQTPQEKRLEEKEKRVKEINAARSSVNKNLSLAKSLSVAPAIIGPSASTSAPSTSNRSSTTKGKSAAGAFDSAWLKKSSASSSTPAKTKVKATASTPATPGSASASSTISKKFAGLSFTADPDIKVILSPQTPAASSSHSSEVATARLKKTSEATPSKLPSQANQVKRGIVVEELEDNSSDDEVKVVDKGFTDKDVASVKGDGKGIGRAKIVKVEEIKEEEGVAVSRQTSPANVDPSCTCGYADLPDWMPVALFQSRVETGLQVFYGSFENPFNLHDNDNVLRDIIKMIIAVIRPKQGYKPKKAVTDHVYQLLCQACHTWLKGFLDFATTVVKTAINKHSTSSVEEHAAFAKDALNGSMSERRGTLHSPYIIEVFAKAYVTKVQTVKLTVEREPVGALILSHVAVCMVFQAFKDGRSSPGAIKWNAASLAKDMAKSLKIVLGLEKKKKIASIVTAAEQFLQISCPTQTTVQQAGPSQAAVQDLPSSPPDLLGEQEHVNDDDDDN